MVRCTRVAVIGLTVAVMAVTTGGLQAQRGGGLTGPQFGAQLIALHQDGYFADSWSPGIGLSVRIPLFSSIVGQVSLSDVYTRRMNEQHCPGSQSCPSPSRIAGGTSTLMASIGAWLPFEGLAAFMGVGYGYTWDDQSSGMLEYGGPTWSWQVSVQRNIQAHLGIEISYRLLRVSWDNDYGSVLQGLTMTHHQISAGVTYSPWADPR